MDPRKLKGLNTEKNNILEPPFPYWWAFQGEKEALQENADEKIVIFFGNDMATFTKTGVDAHSYVQKCNECLDQIRREFTDHRLYYKPHPADKIEKISLNLKGFHVLGDDISAELFLFKNYFNIKSVFSIASAAVYNAYALGLDSHVFYKCFSDIYGDEFIKSLDEFYHDMPASFFITDTESKTENNGHTLKKDENLELFFKNILDKNSGQIWLIAFTVEYITLLIALSKLFKSVDSSRKVGLIVSKHSYWKKVNPDYFNKYFDQIMILPRINYSLKPANLWQAIKTALKIKNFKIPEEDIIISITQNSFVENCLNSYNQGNLKIGLIASKDFNLYYNTENQIYAGCNDFKFNKATWFFNKIFEPMLGLNRTVFMFYGKNGDSFINRYQKPLNEIFDKAVIMKADAI